MKELLYQSTHMPTRVLVEYLDCGKLGIYFSGRRRMYPSIPFCICDKF